MKGQVVDTIPDWITHRYAHHAPRTQARIEAHEALRDEFAMMANVLEQVLPESREKSLAHTLLQEASWAAHAALALYGDELAEEPPESASAQ